MATMVRGMLSIKSILAKGGKPLFAFGLADLSDLCLYYMAAASACQGDQRLHQIRDQPLKRLIPASKTRLLLAYSARQNRSGFLPPPLLALAQRQSASRSFPDRGRDPYLAMPRCDGGVWDGIEHKIHQGGPMDKDILLLPTDRKGQGPPGLRQLARSPGQPKAVTTPQEGGVGSQAFIESYIELKLERSGCLEHTRTRSSSDVRFGWCAQVTKKKGAAFGRPFFFGLVVD